VLRIAERQPIVGRSFLRSNAASGTSFRLFPQVALKEHLLLTMERNAAVAQDASKDLARSRHRAGSSYAAQIEMVARHLECCVDLERHKQRGGTSFPRGPERARKSPVLRAFTDVSQSVKTALNQAGDSHPSPESPWRRTTDVDYAWLENWKETARSFGGKQRLNCFALRQYFSQNR